MRISSNLFFRTGLDSINAQQADLRHIYQQTGSGKRMVSPSDDPLAAAQSINLGQSQAVNQRYADNRQVIRQNLNAEDDVLNSVVQALQDVKTQLIGAGNGVLSDADRRTLADALVNAKSHILALANATDGNGQYLFSGHQQVSGSPFNENGQWNSALSGQRRVQVDQTRQLAASDLGVDVFARAAGGSRGYLTAASSANTGTGLVSSPAITDPNGEHVSKAFELRFTSPTQYDVLVKGTVVAQNQAYDPANSTLALPGGVSVTISGAPAQGDRFTLTPTASLGAGQFNLFESFDDIVTALNTDTAGDPAAAAALRNAITTAIQRFDVHYDNVLTVQTSVGARMAELDAIDNNGAARHLDYTQQLSQLEDLNYYEATTQLQLRTAALEAAALAFRKIQGASFLNLRNG